MCFHWQNEYKTRFLYSKNSAWSTQIQFHGALKKNQSESVPLRANQVIRAKNQIPDETAEIIAFLFTCNPGQKACKASMKDLAGTSG